MRVIVATCTRVSAAPVAGAICRLSSPSTDTGAVRQRVIANPGRLDQLEPKKLDPLIDGLNRALGRSTNSAESVEYDSARAFGDVYALHELWQSLGFGPAIKRALRSSRRSFDAEALVRAMVFNRLCAPDSKLGLPKWLETVAMPAMPESVTMTSCCAPWTL